MYDLFSSTSSILYTVYLVSDRPGCRRVPARAAHPSCDPSLSSRERKIRQGSARLRSIYGLTEVSMQLTLPLVLSALPCGRLPATWLLCDAVTADGSRAVDDERPPAASRTDSLLRICTSSYKGVWSL